MKVNPFVLILLLLFSPLCHAEWEDEGLPAAVRHNTNLNGLTGLSYTGIADTIGHLNFAMNFALASESSDNPADHILSFPLTMTLGIGDAMEIGIVAQYINVYTNDNSEDKSFTDSEISAKWRIRKPQEESPYSLAFGIALKLPTGEYALGGIEDFGLRTNFLISSEITLENNKYIGRYGELELVADDFLEQSLNKDLYGGLNLGLLYPLGDKNQIHAAIELRGTYNKNHPVFKTGDRYSLMPSLRYANKRYNFLGGVEYIKRSDDEAKDSFRFVSSFGFQF